MLALGRGPTARFAARKPAADEAMHALATLSLHCINTLGASPSKSA
jgi:hypothetical protein